MRPPAPHAACEPQIQLLPHVKGTFSEVTVRVKAAWCGHTSNCAPLSPSTSRHLKKSTVSRQLTPSSRGHKITVHVCDG